MNYKVCVYTICKNEIEGIDKWYNALDEADLIVLCDTGSTDGTWEKIQSMQSDRFKVMQYIHDEEIFHFGIARNVSLNFVHEFTIDTPDTKWILIMLDIDEIFDKGGITKIKEQWTENCKSMYIMGYSAHNKGYENGTPQKVHSNDLEWNWYGRIHETLSYEDKPYYDLPQDWFIWSDGIQYTHYQVFDGVKHVYHTHMLKHFEDYPDDLWNLRNLFGDCLDIGNPEEIFKYGQCLIETVNRVSNDDYLKREYAIHAYLGMSEAAKLNNDEELRFKYLYEACKLNMEYNDFFRRPYSMMGKYYEDMGNEPMMLEYYSKAIKNQRGNKNIVDNPYYDSDCVIYSDLSLFYYYRMNDKIKSLGYMELAYYITTDDERRQNYKRDIDIILSVLRNEKSLS